MDIANIIIKIVKSVEGVLYMNIMLMIWLSGILVVIASIVTIIVLKQEEKKSKQYAGADNSDHDAFKRSQEYEENSVKKYIPIQIWSYAIVTVVTLLIILYFMI